MMEAAILVVVASFVEMACDVLTGSYIVCYNNSINVGSIIQ